MDNKCKLASFASTMYPNIKFNTITEMGSRTWASSIEAGITLYMDPNQLVYKIVPVADWDGGDDLIGAIPFVAGEIIQFTALHWQSDWNGYEVGFDEVEIVGCYSQGPHNYYIDVENSMVLEHWENEDEDDDEEFDDCVFPKEEEEQISINAILFKLTELVEDSISVMDEDDRAFLKRAMKQLDETRDNSNRVG